MAEARTAWRNLQPQLDASRLIFLDETWATTNMARSHGRARRGERLVAPVPSGHWHTTTFLCGLRQDGLVAPLVLDGAINGDAFLAYVEQMLCPTLHPGDIVICDNLASHKVSGVIIHRRIFRDFFTFRPSATAQLAPYRPEYV